jgi:hypothetical protein
VPGTRVLTHSNSVRSQRPPRRAVACSTSLAMSDGASREVKRVARRTSGASAGRRRCTTAGMQDVAEGVHCKWSHHVTAAGAAAPRPLFSGGQPGQLQ